jgi:hypothetical protein
MAFHEDGVRVAATFKQDSVYMDSYIWRIEDEFEDEEPYSISTDMLWAPDFNKGISYN